MKQPQRTASSCLLFAVILLSLLQRSKERKHLILALGSKRPQPAQPFAATRLVILAVTRRHMSLLMHHRGRIDTRERDAVVALHALQ